MCGFQVGDEVAVVKDGGGFGGFIYRLWCSAFSSLSAAMADEGDTYLVTDICRHPLLPWVFGLWLRGEYGWFPHYQFRKVQKRQSSLSIEAFLTIKPWQFEEKEAFPVKKRERV